jgi:hypothetical protein
MSEPVVTARLDAVDDEALAAFPALTALWRLWSASAAQGGGRPMRAGIDPLRLPPSAWRHCFLFDALEDGFRIRLYGTYVVELMGRDPTGARLTAAGDEREAQASRHPALRRMLASTAPTLWRHELHLGRADTVTLLLTLVMPLFSPEGRIDMIFGGAEMPEERPGAGGGWSPEKRLDLLKDMFTRGRLIETPEGGRYRLVIG